MPARNSIKTYVEDGYYHIYNRGVEKRTIFQDRQDYQVFATYLSDYLSPTNETQLAEQLKSARNDAAQKEKILQRLRLNNYHDKMVLLAYALMPNHFHLLVQLKQADSLPKFMNSLGTRYAMYFNRKHKRVGALFQDVYKAVLIEDEAYYSHITRYIHRQAIDAPKIEGQIEQPSSFPEYTGHRKSDWVHPEVILELFAESHPGADYAQFVMEYSPAGKENEAFAED